jgi:hypothetical protein
MQKKNLIYIIGGAALVGYFLYMKKKSAKMLPGSEMPSEPGAETPDQALAPAFVNETTDVIKKISRTAKAIKSRLKKRGSNAVDESGMMTSITPSNEGILPASSESSESILLPQSPLSEIMQDMSPASKKSILTARQAKQNVRASGGSAKQARQAAKAVRKEVRAGRKMGELSVTF